MSSMGAQPIVTPGDLGPLINVVTWFLLVASTLAVIARVATKLAVARRIERDDFAIFAALLFSIAQSIAVCFQMSGGLGQHIGTLNAAQLDRFQRSGFAADLLYIANLCFAKLSVLLLLQSITPVALHKRSALAVEATTAFWAVTGEFVAAFQCHLPAPWKFIGNTCINRAAFWSYFGILNILLDLTLILLPLGIVWELKVDLKRKAVIIACFVPRIMVIAAVTAQLVYLNRASDTTDATFDLWPLVLCTQVVQNMSIITACIPYLKPFLESLESGMMRSDDLRRRGIEGINGYSTASSGRFGTNSSSKISSKSARNTVKQSRELEGIDQSNNNTTTITATGDSHNLYDWDAESQRSRSKMIKQTTAWTVD
ncbi:MAG: hypothetical protein M1830_007184 [Pleopsidium flavum]|nr:MAG: hypothetical protein M1830_007184 [Pleopsidium flavum]